ncbi:putative hemoglobin and hemoglobin-haptoglobin-binding protein 2 precursor [compost metagenome]
MQDRLTLTGVPRFRTRDGHYDEKLWNLTSQVDKSFTTGSLAHHLIWGFDAKRIESSNLRKGGEVRLDTGANVPGLETFPLSDFPDPTSDSYGLFVQDSVEIGKLTLLAGLRYDYYKLDPHVTDDYLRSNPPETDPSNYSDDYLSPKLGATYKLTDTESVYGQYAAGFRAPSPVYMFGELDNPGLGYRQIGNPNLKPETSNSYEVGLRGDHSIGNYSLALFYNQYDDFIEQVTTPLPGYFIGQFQWVNVDRATIRGAEAKGELHLQEFGMPSGTHLRGSIAYARGKDEDSGEPLNSVDPLKAVFGVGYAEPAGNYGADLYWTLVAAKDRIDDTQIANQFETPGYGTLDLTGWWRITDEVSVNAGVFNLADKQYWQWGDVQGLSGTSPAVGRFSQPGRNAAVNLVWEI